MSRQILKAAALVEITQFCAFRHRAILMLALLVIVAPKLTAAEPWTPPRTAFDQPNLQGIWGNITQTPLRRPKTLGTKRSYSDIEAKQLVQKMLNSDAERAAPIEADRKAPEAGERIGADADQNFVPENYSDVAVVDGEYRTSLIIDPPDGQIHYIEGAMTLREQWISQGHGAYDGPEIRFPGERCFAYPAHIPLIRPLTGPHSRMLKIIQTEDYVVLYAEYNATARIVHLRQDAAKPAGDQWLGHSTGFWDGDSLLITTTGFRAEQANLFIRSSNQLTIHERLTPVNENELLYEFSFDDPAILKQAFTAQMPLARMPKTERLYDHGCHEGNYSLPGILAGARRQEADALEQQ